MTKQVGGCDGSCACKQEEESRPGRRSFLKAATLAVGGFLSGCATILRPDATATSAPTQTSAQPAAKKAVYLVGVDGYAVGCHAVSEAVLKGNGVTIAYASWKMDPISGGGTMQIEPDLLVENLIVAEYDAILFECSAPMDPADPQILRIAREAVEQDKVLGAICGTPALLAAAGVLKGKKATVNPGLESVLEENGAILTKNDAERDGKIVTASYNGRAKFGPLVVAAMLE